MNEKKILAIIFLLAVFLRIGLVVVREKAVFHKPFYYSGDAYFKTFTSDALWYDAAARGILEGKGIITMPESRDSSYGHPNFSEVYRVNKEYYAHKIIPPIYPLFLALCYFIGGFNTLAYFIPQLLLSSFTCIFIYFLAKDIFNEKVAVLAGLAVACYPDLIFWTYYVRTETLFIFLITSGFWLLNRGNMQSNLYLVLASALVFGLACLTRITFLPFIPVLFIWEVIYFSRNRIKNISAGLLMLLMVMLILLPWCVRNYIVFHNFTPLTDEVNVFFANEEGTFYPEGELYFKIRKSFVHRVAMFIDSHTKEFSLMFAKKFILFWSPITEIMKPFAKVYKGITWIIVFPLAFWGMLIARKKWEKSGLIIIFIFYYSILHAASYVDPGLVYRYPIQPFLCIFAAYAFYSLGKGKPLFNS